MKKFEDLMSVKNEIENISASEAKEKLNPYAQKTFGNEIVTEIKSASQFYRAEEYHQKYFEKRSKR